MTQPVGTRVAGRVLLLDPEDRVLLLGYSDDDGRYWATPGGGVEAGESAQEAALREVVEETGLGDVGLGAHLWSARRRIVSYGIPVAQTEHVWLGRTARPGRVGPRRLADGEAIEAWRWFTAEELLACPDRCTPHRLPELIAELLAHGPWEPPRDLGDQPL